ncbi:hypothetical protein D3C87_1555940 [compost metagenome]
MPGKVQPTLPAEVVQVFGDREHRPIGAVGHGVEGHGRHLRHAGLPAAGVPPFQLDGRKFMTAFAVDTIDRGVDALAAGEVATTVVQGADPRRFQVEAQARDIAQ